MHGGKRGPELWSVLTGLLPIWHQTYHALCAQPHQANYLIAVIARIKGSRADTRDAVQGD